MEILIVVLVLIIVLLYFPFMFEVRLSFNLMKNFGTLSLFFLGIRFNLSKLSIENRTLIVKTVKDRVEKQLELDEKTILLYKNFYSNLYRKLSVRNLTFYSKIGTSNPFISSVIGGFLNSITSLIFLKVKINKPYSEVTIGNKTTFLSSHCMLVLKLRFFISFADIIFSYLRALTLTKKELSYGRKPI